MPSERGRRSSGANDVVWLDDTDIIKNSASGKAILVVNAKGEEVWLPVSQLGFYDDGRYSVPRWLADEKGLEG